jgi:hypothetical protein
MGFAWISVSADRHQPAVTDVHLAMQLDQTLGLAPILRAESSLALESKRT